jgi:small nuclear ribonucleoprotein (snRNP)-like protein
MLTVSLVLDEALNDRVLVLIRESHQLLGSLLLGINT